MCFRSQFNLIRELHTLHMHYMHVAVWFAVCVVYINVWISREDARFTISLCLSFIVCIGGDLGDCANIRLRASASTSLSHIALFMITQT